MSILRSILLALALLGVHAFTAAAQFPGAVAPGARVRLVVPDTVRQAPLAPRQQVLIGTVVGVGQDSLQLEMPYLSGTLMVPRQNVRELSVSLGVPSRTESALREGLQVALLSALVFVATDDGNERFGENLGERAAVGAGVGFGVGAMLGAVWPSERWRRLRLRD